MNQITITADNITIEDRIGGADQQAPKKKDAQECVLHRAL